MSRTKTEEQLEDLASKINADFVTLQSGDKQRRAVIIGIGRNLLKAQKQCKREGNNWEEWFQNGTTVPFSMRMARQYMSIARYPSAFKSDMSIREGAKLCRYAKKHGGQLPINEWKGGQGRRLITFTRKVGKATAAIIKLAATQNDLAELKEDEEWTHDELTGTVSSLEETRLYANKMLRLMKPLMSPKDYESALKSTRAST